MGIWFFDNRWWGRAMPSCHFVHLILLSSGPKVPKSGPFKNEGIHEPPTMILSDHSSSVAGPIAEKIVPCPRR